MARYKIKKSKEAQKAALFDKHYGDVSKLVKESFEDKFARVFNSTGLFVLSYTTLVFAYQLISCLAGLFVGIAMNFHFYRVTVDNYHPLWYFRNVYVFWGSGPLLLLVLGLVACRYYYKNRSHDSVLNLGILWTAIHAFNMIAGQFLMASIGGFNYDTHFYHGVVVLLAWLEWGDFTFYFSSVLALIFIVLLGLLWVKPFLRFSFSQRLVLNYSGKKKYYIQVVFIPAIIGSLLILPFYYPKGLVLYATYTISLFLSLTTGWLTLDYMRKVKIYRYESLQRIKLPLLAAVILLIIMTRVFFIHGLEIGN